MLCQPLQLGYSGIGEFFFQLSGVLLLSLAGLPSYHVPLVRAVDPFLDDLAVAAIVSGGCSSVGAVVTALVVVLFVFAFFLYLLDNPFLS